jgi:chromosome segregation ATPase
MEDLLQRVLDKVEGLESKVTSQISNLEAHHEAVQTQLQAVQGRLDGVQGRLGRLEDKVESVQDGQAKLEEKVDTRLAGLEDGQAELKHKVETEHNKLETVVAFAEEKRVRRKLQQEQQGMFTAVLHIVASAGFVKEVMVCFSLNRGTWNDVRLWSIVINKKYEHARES